MGRNEEIYLKIRSEFLSLDPKERRLFKSTNMTGKLYGVHSFSSSNRGNHICECRKNDKKSICSKCFADKTERQYSGALHAHLENNLLLLSKPMTETQIEACSCYEDWIRFESFGDLQNQAHAENFIAIAYEFPECTFVDWTKNWGFMDKAINKMGKPKNLINIISSPYINTIVDPSRYWWVDHVFTVFSKPYIAEHNVEINCGGRKCRDCKKCYTRGNPIFFINEEEK